MDKNKIKIIRNRTILLIIVIIAIIGGLRTYDDLKRNNQILDKQESHLQQAILHEYTKEISNIKNVLQLNGSILSKSKEVINFLKNKDRENLYKFSKPFLDSLESIFPNESRIHFHTPQHISFLRVHQKYEYGDNLQKTRAMVSHTITTKQNTSGYEHGLNDGDQLTYRMTFPIFDGKKFLGVVEIGIDTKFIIEKIKTLVKNIYDRDIQIIVIIKNDTPNFNNQGNFNKRINGHLYRSQPNIDDIISVAKSTTQTQTVKLEDQHYSLKLTQINLLDYNNKTIGNYFSITNITKDIQQNNIFFYSSLAKPIIATVLIVLLVVWLFHIFYKQFLLLEKRTRSILDAQSSLIVLSDGDNIIDCNHALLAYYGFESLDEFKQHHNCICDTFEKDKGLLQKEEDGLSWIEQMVKNNNSIFKVKIKDHSQEMNTFNITLNTYIQDQARQKHYYVITLTNISSLEKANAQLIEQSKQISLGEMIGNIAHQWRQPLSAISTLASGISLRIALDQLNTEALKKDMDLIVDRSQYLSDTIDTFRNFIKEKKELQTVILQDRLNVALSITRASITDNYIQLIKELEPEPIEIRLVVGELTQVLINIINNAKDAIMENHIENSYIKISMYTIKDYAVITIEDNAGGIPKDVLPKIFEPYFTTKHKSQGTGLGLYMSYRIITESLNGDLGVENTKDGAKFTIKLPLDN